MNEPKRAVQGTRGENPPTPHPALLGLAALLVEIASKSSGSQTTSNGILEPAPLDTGTEVRAAEGEEGGDHGEREVPR
jgi:hypothetical protein